LFFRSDFLVDSNIALLFCETRLYQKNRVFQLMFGYGAKIARRVFFTCIRRARHRRLDAATAISRGIDRIDEVVQRAQAPNVAAGSCEAI
jgi:hypothetical protein